jgi:phage terminase small subunit
VRAVNRIARSLGTATDVCTAPPHLDAVERKHWRYYAPLLAAAGRLTLEARDTLAKYCSALATVVRLKEQMRAPEYRDVIVTTSIDSAGNEHVNAKPNPLLTLFRQWLMVSRNYEADLLLSPATAIRVPAPQADPEPPPMPHNFYGEGDESPAVGLEAH